MKQKSRLTYTQIIVLGFIGIILLGAVLLSLPAATQSGKSTPFFNSLFTAVSSTCVIGLSVYNTAAYWSVFGQAVILCLVQVGGIGLVSLICIASLIARKQLSLYGRRLVMEAAGAVKLGGITAMLKRLVMGTFLFEAVGAVILTVRFCFDMPFSKALYFGVFHSVSAFCNAGISLFRNSLGDYSGDVTVNLTVIALSLIGGLGFFVWNDIRQNKLNFKKYELHTKIVLVSTAVLIIFGWAVFFVAEQNASMANMPLPQKILVSLFQAVAPRTVGFTTVAPAKLSETGSIATLFLMFIGGNPGSTSGGVKTTTFTVLLAAVFSVIKGNRDIYIFKRKIAPENIRHAVAVFVIYFMCILIFSMCLCIIEPITAKEALFETVAALCTSGISLGITGVLSGVSKVILMVLMLMGRIGGLSLILAFSGKSNGNKPDRPTEKILIG